MNPSYFDVNYRGTIGFDTLPTSKSLNPLVFCTSTGLALQWVAEDRHFWAMGGL